MAYKPNTWVITTQKRETYVIEGLEKIVAHYMGDENLTDIAMGESSTVFEVYKTDDNGLRCDPKYGVKEFKTICSAETYYRNIKLADEKNYPADMLCPFCGEYLGNGLGVLSKSTQVLKRGGFYTSADVEETEGYYCPECGADLDWTFADKIAIKLENDEINY